MSKRQRNTKVLPAERKALMAERRLLEKINSTTSVAKATGSVAQEFTRIKDIVDRGDGILLILNATPERPDVSKFLSYRQALAHLYATKQTIPLMNLVDAKAASEMLLMLEHRLYEALTAPGLLPEGGIEPEDPHPGRKKP